jgi:hypothetical protein
MFGWFRTVPKPPVDFIMQEWIEDRMHWLVDQFGQNLFLSLPTITPSEEFFPDTYHAREEDAIKLFPRICEYTQVPINRVNLNFYKDDHPYLGRNALGLYEKGDQQQSTVWVESSDLSDPMEIVAVLTHELCHEKLLGENRISATARDHEPLTDLLTVFLGMGIFTSNGYFRNRKEWTEFQVIVYAGGAGYLTMSMFGYALAIYAWWRREINPKWTDFLHNEVRHAYRQGWEYLCSAENKRVKQLINSSQNLSDFT